MWARGVMNKKRKVGEENERRGRCRIWMPMSPQFCAFVVGTQIALRTRDKIAAGSLPVVPPGCPTSRPRFSSPAVQSRVRLKQFPVSPRFTGALNAFLSPSDPPDSASFAVPSHGCMPAPLSRDRRLVSLCQPVVVRDRSGKSVV